MGRLESNKRIYSCLFDDAIVFRLTMSDKDQGSTVQAVMGFAGSDVTVYRSDRANAVTKECCYNVLRLLHQHAKLNTRNTTDTANS